MKKYEKEVVQAQLDNEKAVLKQLERNYKDALEEIDSKIANLMGRDDADMQHVIYQVEYQRALKAQTESILLQLQTNEFETVSEYLTKCYNEGFLGTMYSMQSQGIPLVFPINQEEVVAAIQHETNLTSSLYKAFDTKDLQKKIAAEISRGFSTGASFKEVARNVASAANISKNNAARIARTEGHRITESAAYSAQQKAKDRGADVVKVWDAALDSKTRPSHVRVDGEIRELKEKFSNGLKYPGDPAGSAAEVINCRCRSRTDARWALDADETKILGDTSKMSDDQRKAIADKLGIPVDDIDLYSDQIVPINAKDYADFKRQYNKLWQYEGSALQQKADPKVERLELQRTGQATKKEVKAKPEFTPAATVEDAAEYAKDVLGISQTTAYSLGMNVDVANGLNEALYKINNEFGNLSEKGYLDNVLLLTKKTGAYAAYQKSLGAVFLNPVVKTKGAIKKMAETATSQFELGAWSTGNAFHTVYHELGHAVQHMTLDADAAKMNKIDVLYNKTFSDILGKDTAWTFDPKKAVELAEKAKQHNFSYYGLNNSGEFIAESVAQYFLSDNPSDIAKDVVEILKGK